MNDARHIRILAGLLAGGIFWTAGANHAIAQNQPTPAPTFIQDHLPNSAITVAQSGHLARYGWHLNGGAHTNGAWTGGWQILAAVAAWAGDTRTDARLLAQINYNLNGSNSISGHGGYGAQHETNVTAMYAILKQSPRFWGLLDETQRNKIDLVMKAALIGSAYTTADSTYANGKTPKTLDGSTNVNRGWNANYREGMYGNLIAASVYFGHEEAKNILKTYDHNAFVSQLQTAGLTNTLQIFNGYAAAQQGFTAPTAADIQNTARNYKHNGQDLPDPFDLYSMLTLTTYSKVVKAGLNNGAGIIRNGVPTGTIVQNADGLPNKGQVGMLMEFDTTDASGARSSITYAYDAFRPNLANHAAVLFGGYWESGTVATELIRRLDVGITDLVYKLENGYRNYQHGQGSTQIIDINFPDRQQSFTTVIPLWNEVLKPYHITPPPLEIPGRVVSLANTWQNFELDRHYSIPLTVTFDATALDSGLDGLVGVLNGEADAFGDLAAIVRFNASGSIDARNGSTYTASNIISYAKDQVFHIRMEIDPTTRTYSVFVTPEGGSEILLADNFAFRTEQSATSLLTHWAIWSNANPAGNLAVDNMTVVPEPSAALAVSISAAAGLLSQRRRRTP